MRNCSVQELSNNFKEEKRISQSSHISVEKILLLICRRKPKESSSACEGGNENFVQC